MINPLLNPVILFPDRTSTHITQITQLHIKPKQHPRINESSGTTLSNPQISQDGMPYAAS